MTDLMLSDSDTVDALDDVFVFPLSFAQQRLWFFQQMYPQSSAYNMPVAIRLRGQLQVLHLQAAINDLALRHEVLRTSIDLVDGQPAQIISQPFEIPLPLEDLSGLPEAEREIEARRLASTEIERNFDFKRGPLWRGKLFRLGTQDHVLILVVHHISCDGWSINVLINEVSAFYGAHASGKSLALPELPVQYADYSVWQREWLQGAELEKQLAYWREQLRGAPPVLALPFDKPRPQVQTLKGGHVSFIVPHKLSTMLRQLCWNEGITLFMLMLGAFQL